MDSRSPSNWLPLIGSAVSGALTGFLSAVGLHFGLVLTTLNEGTVVPGHVYRSSQPHPSALSYLVSTYGIRTVLNLRGCCPGLGWYQTEARTTAEMGLAQQDILFSAGRMPSRISIRQLVEALDRSPRPLLLHCQQGVDRTGLGAAIATLLYTDATPAQAMRELCIASGHVALARTRHIGRFFTVYRAWLADLGLEHSPAVFRVWATRHYVADGALAEWFVPQEPVVASPLVRVRCRNLSPQTWRFWADNSAGIHARWCILDAEGGYLATGTVGLFDREVPPGGEIEVGIPLPPLRPGPHRLLVELFDEQHASFTQLGSPPLDIEVAAP